jgi:hypothetical protein
MNQHNDYAVASADAGLRAPASWCAALMCVVALSAVAGAVHAQPPAEAAAQQQWQLPPQVTRAEDVLVPVASEIFRTLDKFKHSNWRAVQRPELATWRPRGEQSAIALLLGAIIAEGFIAVEAEDAAEMKSLGRSLLTLARGLGVERWALKRSRSIVDHAESGDWAGVRKEWDGVLPDLQEGMNELQSQQLAHLVSLGGWARGTEAFAALLGQRYSPEDAELLRQPAMLEHFARQLAAISGETGRSLLISRTRKSLEDFRRTTGAAEGPISRETVQEMGRIAAELVSAATGESRNR